MAAKGKGVKGLSGFVGVLRKHYPEGCRVEIGSEFAATIVADFDALSAKAEAAWVPGKFMGIPIVVDPSLTEVQIRVAFAADPRNIIEFDGCAPPVIAGPLNEPFGNPEELPLNEPSGDSGQLASLEQRARELLAAEYRAAGMHEDAYLIACGGQLEWDTEAAIRAITAALSAQPQSEVVSEPGAIRALVTAANAVLALYPADDGMWTLEQAVRPFNAAKPGECANGCPDNQVCDYCQFAAPQPREAIPRHADEAHKLLREVVENLEAVGCGPCVGSYAPMEDLHGRIERYLATQPADDWRPIETAPKDGTEILLAVSSRYGWSRVLASWESFGWVDSEVRQVEQGHYVAVYWMPLAPLPTKSEATDGE